MRLPARLDALLRGPTPALPRPVDVVSERWARLRPRTRLLLGATAVLAVLGSGELRVQAVQARWGGEPVVVLVAAADLPVGSRPEDLHRLELPPAAAPSGALTEVPAGATLAYPLPAGSVLTAAHLDQRGPSALLGGDARAVPIPVEAGWGVVTGGWVDVWVLGVEEPAVLVARSRPVLEVRDERALTALVSIEGEQVRAVTAGLAAGQVLLTHAPAPDPSR